MDDADGETESETLCPAGVVLWPVGMRNSESAFYAATNYFSEPVPTGWRGLTHPEPLHQYDAEFLMARGRNYAVIVLYWSQRRAAKINRRRYTTSARYFGRIEVRMICFSSFYFVRLTGSEVTSIPVSIELIAHRVAPVYSWQIPTGPQHLECT